MPTKPKQEEPKREEPPSAEELVAGLREEVIAVLEEYLDALNTVRDKNPGEHNVAPIRTAQDALNLFRPPNSYPG